MVLKLGFKIARQGPPCLIVRFGEHERVHKWRQGIILVLSSVLVSPLTPLRYTKYAQKHLHKRFRFN